MKTSAISVSFSPSGWRTKTNQKCRSLRRFFYKLEVHEKIDFRHNFFGYFMTNNQPKWKEDMQKAV